MGTKIFVIKLRELVKNILFTVIGIVIIGFIISLFLPIGDKEAKYEAGTYSAAIVLHNNPVEVEVTVSATEITDIKLLNMDETQEVFYPLFDDALAEVAEQVVNNQTTDIVLSEDYTVTGSILLDAVDNALLEASIE